MCEVRVQACKTCHLEGQVSEPALHHTCCFCVVLLAIEFASSVHACSCAPPIKDRSRGLRVSLSSPTQD